MTPELSARVHALIAQWKDPEFFNAEGCLMDSFDCAKALEAALAAALAPPVTFSETTVNIPQQPGPGTTTGPGTIVGSVFDPTCNAVAFENASYALEAVKVLPLAQLQSVMIEREWQEALGWREIFLENDEESSPLRALPNQLVCYLIADCMTFRELVAAALAPQPEQKE